MIGSLHTTGGRRSSSATSDPLIHVLLRPCFHRFPLTADRHCTAWRGLGHECSCRCEARSGCFPRRTSSIGTPGLQILDVENTPRAAGALHLRQVEQCFSSAPSAGLSDREGPPASTDEGLSSWGRAAVDVGSAAGFGSSGRSARFWPQRRRPWSPLTRFGRSMIAEIWEIGDGCSQDSTWHRRFRSKACRGSGPLDPSSRDLARGGAEVNLLRTLHCHFSANREAPRARHDQISVESI
jgi:hypothetical protein